MTDQQQQNSNIQLPLSDLDKPVETTTTTTTQTTTTAEEDLAKNPTNTASDKLEDKPATEVTKPEDKKPVEEVATETTDEVATPEAFWGEVSKLRGDDLQFAFPEDIEDPLSPQAVHHAVKLAEERAIADFEQTLQREDSRAYAYMLHRANGGSDEQFFASKTEVLPEVDVLKNSVDLQQAFYKRALTGKGILPEQADLIIKDAVEKNKLFGLVESEHKAIGDMQKKQLDELLRINQANQAREEQLINHMAGTLQEKILQNKGMNITIPDARRAEFLQFVNGLMELDRYTGKWFIRHEVTSDNMSQVLGSLYYMNVNGNLADIITNKANQQNVKKVQLSMKNDKTKTTTAKTDPNKVNNEKTGVNPALSEL